MNRSGAWQRVRQEARRRRAEVGEDASTDAVLAAAARACGLGIHPLPPADALLSGAHAVLDTEAQTIWLRADLAPGARRLVLAHELAHCWLHHAPEDEPFCPCDEDDFAPDGTTTGMTGYGPRERRETEANVFAREFLLPGPLLARRFRDEGWSAEEIAARAGLPLAAVLRQLADTLLCDEEGEAVRGPSPAPALDPTQQTAARAASGPLLVGAGPGTGKTRTLVARVLYLTGEQGVSPDSLLVLTFARRAAEEMRERIGRDAPEVARRAFIGTFHAYGLDLLRRHWQLAGLPPRPLLLDPVDAFALLERRIAALELGALRYLHDPAYPLPDVLRCIARAKEERTGPEAMVERARAAGEERLLDVARVWAAYESLLRERGALDLSDLVARAVGLLEENPDVLRHERARWQHVLVDEYQDVNRAGAHLVRLLAGEDGAKLWAVGDLRQAIYAFRGASPANVTRFASDYAGGRRADLGVNYRSRRDLVALFGGACGEGAETWRAARTDAPGAASPAAILAVAEDDTAQAEHIARRMGEFAAAGYRFGDQAVLCRTRGQAAALRAALTRRGVPVAPGGGSGWWTSEDVKDLLALLARVAEPGGPARHRARGEPPADLLTPRDAWEFFARALFGPHGAARRVTDGRAVARLLALATSFGERAAVLAEEGEDPRRAFLRHVRRAVRMDTGGGEETDAPTPDAVRVLTIHAAKGLEFPVVFVPNLSRGKFPPQPAPALLPRWQEEGETGGRESEETRLFFVALTRARDHLIVSRAQRYNGRRHEPSPLLACLEGVAGVRGEFWKGSETRAPDAPAGQPVAVGGEPVRLDAGDAELYARCPRRFYYERVLELPVGEPSAYARFKHAVGEALRSGDPVTELAARWGALGPDPAHPHEALYRRAAEEIVTRAANAPPGNTPDALAVQLENGVVSIRPDEADAGRHVRHSFRKPPRDDKVEPEPRLSLLREAAERHAAPAEVTIYQRYVRTGESLPVPPPTARQRARHLETYERALRGVRLRVFPADPGDLDDCPVCPFFFVCPA